MKVKNILILEGLSLFLSAILFVSSFFFSVSFFCDYIEELHPLIVFILRVSALLIFIIFLISSLYIAFSKKCLDKLRCVIIVFSIIISVIASAVCTKITCNNNQYYDKNSIVAAGYESFFPYQFEETELYFAKYNLPHTNYVAAYNLSGILETEISYHMEYFSTKSFLMMQQFKFQSHNYYKSKIADESHETITQTSEGFTYQILKLEEKIVLVIKDKNSLFFCSISGSGYDEQNYPTDEFVYYATALYKKCLKMKNAG